MGKIRRKANSAYCVCNGFAFDFPLQAESMARFDEKNASKKSSSGLYRAKLMDHNQLPPNAFSLHLLHALARTYLELQYSSEITQKTERDRASEKADWSVWLRAFTGGTARVHTKCEIYRGRNTKKNSTDWLTGVQWTWYANNIADWSRLASKCVALRTMPSRTGRAPPFSRERKKTI